MKNSILIYSLVLFAASIAVAQDFKLQTVQVLGTQESYVEPGSIYQISEEQIKERRALNPNEVLKDVPGVTIQEEDGLGLRPNIGLRGTLPNRSKKITLLEDGVLIAPAPYSAPAAYYFPFMPRVTGVEVYKGPSSVKYGPNSIGGAINFITRDFTDKPETNLNYSYGSYETQRLGVWTSGEAKNFKWLAEVNRIQSEGFKNLPDGGDTSLEKNDILLKGRYNFQTDRTRILDFKFSWGNERSNETYLGLTQDDFNDDAFQRYEASRLDLFDWEHKQYKLKYFNEWSDSIFSDFTLYRNEFTRVWDKLNGFADSSVDIRDVLNSPTGQNADFLAVLKGDKDSTPSERLRYGISDRSYYSQGLSIDTRFTFAESSQESHHLDLGLLYHTDEIERSHRLQDADVVGGRIQKSAPFVDVNNSNIDDAQAFRVFLVETYENEILLLRAGARYENVRTRSFNKATNVFDQQNSFDFFVPGAGVSFKLTPTNLVFFGANKGYTVPGPGQAPQVQPEEAWNFEMGYRYKGDIQLELVGFYSDYENLLGTCTFSTGCNEADLDAQFNGGNAQVRGIEFLTGTEVAYNNWSFPIRLTATYTDAVFNSSFTSNNKEWGLGAINPGDPLPYISDFVASLNLGLKYKKFRANFLYNWRSKSYDQAAPAGRIEIPAFDTLNANFRYDLNKRTEIFLNIENALNNEYLSSVRPFGLRPGAPFWMTAGASYTF